MDAPLYPQYCFRVFALDPFQAILTIAISMTLKYGKGILELSFLFLKIEPLSVVINSKKEGDLSPFHKL